VYAVRHYPLNWTAFKGQGAAGDEEVFDYLWHFITAMSEQPVPTHADTKTATHPVKDDRNDHCRPTPEKESRDGSKMRNNQKDPGAPVDAPFSRWRGFGMVFKYHPIKLP